MTSTAPVGVPGRMIGYISGSSLGQRSPDHGYGEGGDALVDALDAAEWRRSGSKVVDIPVAAVIVLFDLATFCLAANSDEPDRGEVSAAKAVIERCQSAYKTLTGMALR